MAEATKNANVDLPCWLEGIEAKSAGKGKPWGREEFDKLTGNYDVSRPADPSVHPKLIVGRLC